MSTNNFIIIILVILSVLVSAVNHVVASPSAKLTIKVIDTEHQVIQGAKVVIGFTKAKTIGWGTISDGVEGISDENGMFVGAGSGSSYVTIRVFKEGYYFSGQKYEFKKVSFHRWQPWNPTIEIVLKEKKNPVPMYLKNTDYVKIPVVGEPVGYDLEKGDWVVPYGKGSSSDFVLTYKIDIRSYRDYESSLLLSFTNAKDGIQEYYPEQGEQSYYKWPFEASSNGYESELRKEKLDTPDGGIVTNSKRYVDYIFRVRTKTDKKGNIVEAKYGKISGEFEFGRKGQIKFVYYFNPLGTPNLEYDPNQNLFD